MYLQYKITTNYARLTYIYWLNITVTFRINFNLSLLSVLIRSNYLIKRLEGI